MFLQVFPVDIYNEDLSDVDHFKVNMETDRQTNLKAMPTSLGGGECHFFPRFSNGKKNVCWLILRFPI